MIDLSRMRAVTVDALASRARFEGGGPSGQHRYGYSKSGARVSGRGGSAIREPPGLSWEAGQAG